MPNVTIRYNVWKAGAKRRSPGPKFDSSQIGPLPTNDSVYPVWVPATKNFIPLSFVSVTGSANGHYVIANYPNPVYIPAPSDPPPAFAVPPPPADQGILVNVAEESDLTASVWYIPIGGPGTGDTAAYVDSFNVDTGAFFYNPNIANDFVTVSPDGGLTANANDSGWVPTASAETITSHDQILGVPFLSWVVMAASGPGVAVNGKELKIDAKTSVTAIAFFGTENLHPPVGGYIEFYEATWHRLYPGEDIDAPRPGDPDPPQWFTAVKQIKVLLAMNAAIDRVDRGHRADVQGQITLAFKALTDGLNKTMEGGVG